MGYRAPHTVIALIFCAHHKDQWQLLFWGNKVFMTPHCIPPLSTPTCPGINIVFCELVQPINKLSYTKKWLHCSIDKHCFIKPINSAQLCLTPLPTVIELVCGRQACLTCEFAWLQSSLHVNYRANYDFAIPDKMVNLMGNWTERCSLPVRSCYNYKLLDKCFVEHNEMMSSSFASPTSYW